MIQSQLHSSARVAVAFLLWSSSVDAAISPLMAPPSESGSPSVASSVHEELAASEGISRSTSGILLPKTPITMNFFEADIRDVFRLLALKSSMNIIYGSDVTGTITLNLDRVAFDQAFQTVLTLKNLVALPMGERVIRVVTSSTLTEEQSKAAIFTKVFRLNYANATEVKSPLDAVRSAAGRRGISTVDSKSNALVITDTPEGLQQAEDLIRELDKKPQQVDIEAKIVEVQLNDRSDMGISWSYAAQNKEGDTFIGATDDADGPGAGTGGAATGGVELVGPSSGGTGVSLPGLNDIGNNIAFTFLTAQGSYLLSAKLEALAREQRVKVLSSPHIMTLNNEEARINVIDQIPYKTTNTTSGGSVQENYSFVDAGIKLTVKPTINSDRRITLKVKPEASSADTSTSPPTIATRNAETTITLKDGETMAIGGLIQETDIKFKEGIPFLMDIPLFGYFFRRSGTRKVRTELIVFITPRIAGE